MKSHAELKAITEPGLYRAGETLYLQVAESGAKSWVQRIMIHGKRRNIGLGSFRLVTLAKARRARRMMRAVFLWAQAHGLIDNNPAGDMIDGALPAQPAIKAHLRAMPYQDVTGALDTIAQSSASRAAIPNWCSG